MPVAQPLQGTKDFPEPDGALSGNQVLMRPGRGDVFDVHVTHPLKQCFKRDARVFTRAEKMADVKVDAHRRRPDFPDKFTELRRVFHQEIRLGLHQDADVHFFGQGHDPIQTGVKVFEGLPAGHWAQRPPGRDGYVAASQRRCGFQAVQRVPDADFPALGIGFNPGGEVGVAHGKQRKAVEVGDRQAPFRQKRPEPGDFGI